MPSSGIGRAYAKRLARDLVARRQGRLAELGGELEKLAATAEIVIADLTTPAGLAAVKELAAAGDLTMLVDNAGLQAYRPFVELDPDVAEAQPPYDCSRPPLPAALPAMLERGDGAMVNVSSMGAFSAGMGQPYMPKRATYAGTKAFVSVFTETLAGELAGTGVRVQALCPGVVRTEFHDVDGKPLLRPNAPVMEPEDVVEASLAGLSIGDVICSLSLEDRGLLDREREARLAIFGAGRGIRCRRAIANGRRPEPFRRLVGRLAA